MGIDLLDNPIRVTWDLQGDGFRMSDSAAEIVLQRLVDARLFFVTLEQRPFAHPYCGEILQQLTAAGVQTLLLCDGTEEELSCLSIADNLPVTLLVRLQSFISTKGPDYTRLKHVIKVMRSFGLNPGLSLTPLKSNIAYLKPLLEFCKDLEIQRFKLPNINIDDNFQQSVKAQVLRSDDLDILRQNLPDPALLKEIDLEVHDLFLWEILARDSAGSRSEYGGCQAGNSLAHIRSDATVLPCVTWPKPLGSLLEQDFSDIWLSEVRSEICQSIAAQPAGCAACKDYQLCFGGCRGLSKVLDIDDSLDPMCSGPR